jgi:hypothetical protein
MRIPDLPLPDQRQSDTALRVAASAAGTLPRRPISYVYSIDLTANPTAAPNDFDRSYLIKDGNITKTSNNPLVAIPQIASALAQGSVLRYPHDFDPQFEAQPGYRFDPSVIKITVDSYNPPGAPLPSSQCSPEHRESCFEVSPDFQELRLHIRLYAGSVADRAHGWLHGGLLTRQIPRD